jgi:hypothetical protein
MINGPAAIAAGDPLAVTPDKHRRDQGLVLDRTGHGAGHGSSGLRIVCWHDAKRDGEQNGQKQPYQRSLHGPNPLTAPAEATDCRLPAQVSSKHSQGAWLQR